jgi:hypothetical protein
MLKLRITSVSDAYFAILNFVTNPEIFLVLYFGYVALI